MKTEYNKWGTKNIICDNWGEFFNQFKNWHAKNKGVIPPENIHNEEKFGLYVGWEGESFGDFCSRNEKGETHLAFTHEHYANNARVWAVETVLGNFHKVGLPVNELAVLVLNLHYSEVRYNDWKKQGLKASKVLREIWVKGETKNYQGLDLNWPIRNDEDNHNSNQIVEQQKTNTKQTIIKLLKDNSLKTYNLPLKHQNWETDLKKLDSESKIKDFQQELEKAIQTKKNEKPQNSENNVLSLPVKLLIGGGVIVVVLGLVSVIWWKKRKK